MKELSLDLAKSVQGAAHDSGNGGVGGTRFPNVKNNKKKESRVMKILNGGLRKVTGRFSSKDKSDYNLNTSGGGGIRG